MAKTIKIGGRLESVETGNIVAGANQIIDDAKNKKQSVINAEVDAELVRLDETKQGNLTFDNAPTEDSNNPVKSGGVYAAEKLLSDAIEAILLLIPSAASALNKLVDMQTMNSSIATATATFRGTYNVVSDLELAYNATHEQIAAKLAEVITTADNNDYAFVQIPVSATSQDIAKTERYKFNGEAWAYEYDLNNSGFTQAQWNAINSTVTAALVSKLSALPTATELQTALNGKQDNLTFDVAPTSGSQNPVTSGGIYSRNAEIVALINALDTAKQDKLTFDSTPTQNSINPVTSNGVYVAVSALQAAIVALDAAKQNVLTFDSTPTLGSNNPVTSSGIKTELNRIDGDIVTLNNLYQALTQSALVVVALTDTWPVDSPDAYTIYRVVDRENTPPQYYSDYMFSGSTPVLMAQYDNAIESTPIHGSDNIVSSTGIDAYVAKVSKFVSDISILGKGTYREDRLTMLYNTGRYDYPVALKAGHNIRIKVQTSVTTDLFAYIFFVFADGTFRQTSLSATSAQSMEGLLTNDKDVVAVGFMYSGTMILATQYIDTTIEDLDNVQVIQDYAFPYTSFNKAWIDNTPSVKVKTSDNYIDLSMPITGANVYGFQFLLAETTLKIGETITYGLYDVTVLSGQCVLMVLFYDNSDTFISSSQISLSTSSLLKSTVAIPANTKTVVVRFQSINNTIVSLTAGRMFLFGGSWNTIDYKSCVFTKFFEKGQMYLDKVYVDAVNGNDGNNGSASSPLKTFSKAFQYLKGDATVVLSGDIKEAFNISGIDGASRVRLIGKAGKRNRIILGQNITSATAVSGQTGVFSYAIADFPSGENMLLYQHEVADVSTLISIDERHPLQRNKEYRLESTRIKRASSYDDVLSSEAYLYYYDTNSSTLYFKVPNTDLSSYPVVIPTRDNGVYGNDGSIKFEMDNIEVWYGGINLNGCNDSKVSNCSACYGANGGFFMKDVNGLVIEKCEAGGTHDSIDPYGDGFGVGASSTGTPEGRHTNVRLIDCWAHDNADDGYSDHFNCECVVDGGLFEYNVKGGITSSYGCKDVVKNAYARNNVDFGIVCYGAGTTAQRSSVLIAMNCVSEGNKNNFGAWNGSTSYPTKATFISCISKNASEIGFAEIGTSTVIVKLTDCSDLGSTAAKSDGVEVENTTVIQ